MSFLIVQLPTRRRLGAGTPAAAASTPTELAYVLSQDGRHASTQGHCAPSLLPKATSVVAVVADTDIAYHRITCPKAPAARLRAALGGVLEDTLLDEPETLHLALEPGAQTGSTCWVAAIDRAWLTAQIEALEAHGLQVDRIAPQLSPLAATGLPSAPPDTDREGRASSFQPSKLSLAAASAIVHIHAASGVPADHGADDIALVSWADADGAACWPMQGTLARALLPEPLPIDLHCSASPALVHKAEAWLGQPVHVMTATERLLQAAQGGWNLRQFELAPHHRGAAWLRDGLRQLRTPAWAPVRWGLAGLLAVQVVGLNAWAWQQRTELQTRRDSILAVMRSTHPQVRAILDAPLQMRRENETLRAAAGRAGDTDLEPMLQAAASAWPEAVPMQTVRFENQQLSLGAPGLGEAQIQRLRDSLGSSGWQVESGPGVVTLRRARANTVAANPTGAPQ